MRRECVIVGDYQEKSSSFFMKTATVINDIWLKCYGVLAG